ncbi:MAG TPA: UDP-N-acetylmuramoyl-L-alanine--D-glutamate ligase [Sphingomicrobium sp.]|nr:UDP-N-acetylmuramoyl-L-alanine--D-glutamate ligase [Sphingomicrobium sp.]
MITAKAFAGKHYAVYGLARSGLATVEALLASGARVTAWDAKEEARAALKSSPSSLGEGDRSKSGGGGGGATAADAAAPPPSSGWSPSPSKLGEDLVIADLDEVPLHQFDSLIVTPGLPLNRHPIAQRAREAGVEIIGDIELFARARPELPPHKVVGITGTNGKSTTTALIHHILKTAGMPAAMGGNIGLPILAQDPLPEGGVYVLELSSYQLDLTQSLDCDVAVLLNITPDHLDRYESFDAYAASKERLLLMQSQDHKSVINWECFERGLITPETAGFNGIIPSRTDEQTHWPALQGPHNAENAGAAREACQWLGVSDETIEEGLRSYPGLPHRMELIRERDGVLFVNDSKATNPTATAPALAAFPSIRWILGGQAKTDSLDECAPHFGHVRSAYTIGEAGELFARLLAPHMPVANCETLENALNHAAEDSQPGDTVLLSPACASFDQFRDFEQRGDRFRDLVGAL